MKHKREALDFPPSQPERLRATAARIIDMGGHLAVAGGRSSVQRGALLRGGRVCVRGRHQQPVRISSAQQRRVIAQEQLEVLQCRASVSLCISSQMTRLGNMMD